jgi:hypothetical protein
LLSREIGVVDKRMKSLRRFLASAKHEETIDWRFADGARITDIVLGGVASSAIEKAASLGECVATFARPGVYANGSRATVVFEISPEYHGRFAISSPARVGGVWQVERRHPFE